MIYISCCVSGHRKTFSGPFAKARNKRWWKKHNLCDTRECNTCWKHFDKNVHIEGSFYTCNGDWFCSDKCGKKAGW